MRKTWTYETCPFFNVMSKKTLAEKRNKKGKGRKKSASVTARSLFFRTQQSRGGHVLVTGPPPQLEGVAPKGEGEYPRIQHDLNYNEPKRRGLIIWAYRSWPEVFNLSLFFKFLFKISFAYFSKISHENLNCFSRVSLYIDVSLSFTKYGSISGFHFQFRFWFPFLVLESCLFLKSFSFVCCLFI